MKIIAEFCQNHNGDIDILKEMIKEAAKSGATYAKIQTMFADELTHRQRFDIGKESIKRPYDAEHERLKPLELNWDEHKLFINECKKHNIKPLTTIFTRASIPTVKTLGFKEVKVASYDCGSFQMIKELKDNFKHLYTSTGASLYDEIEKTADILKKCSFSYLHCTTIYPTPLESLNLAKMKYLKKFTNEVGFSDHTLVRRDGIKASVVAIMLGAEIIERHFTILTPDKTKDGPVSINPEQLKQLAEISKMKSDEIKKYVKKEIPDFEKMIGETKPYLTLEELRNRDYYRGRFASKKNNEDIYNYEETKL